MILFYSLILKMQIAYWTHGLDWTKSSFMWSLEPQNNALQTLSLGHVSNGSVLE